MASSPGVASLRQRDPWQLTSLAANFVASHAVIDYSGQRSVCLRIVSSSDPVDHAMRIALRCCCTATLAWLSTLATAAGLFAAEPAAENSAAFLKPPQVIAQPGDEYAKSTRRFQGIPSLTRAPGGRLWAVWYGGRGAGEDQHNYVIAVTSGDDGRTWTSASLVIDPDGEGPVRAFDPEAWIDPQGKLWIFVSCCSVWHNRNKIKHSKLFHNSCKNGKKNNKK